MKSNEEQVKITMATSDSTDTLPPVRGGGDIPTSTASQAASAKKKKSVKPREYRDWDK